MSKEGSREMRFQAPRGTGDVLPEDEQYWNLLRQTGERVCHLAGYRRIETPIFEDARLFLKGSGESTDIARKEMYEFEDRGGERLALRPEGTPNVARAYLEHGMQALPQPVRLFYIAPVFRYDRPQAGRYRQHTQLGVEVIGEGDALVDAEVIDLLASFYEALGLRGLTLQLNSIGDQECRPAYVSRLREYYELRLDSVCADCRARFVQNPLRLLDCKEERCQPVIAEAPVIAEHLCEPCDTHFSHVRGYLDALGITYELDPRLVRGLDYYTRTVFEFQPQDQRGQSTVGAGGRYDGLIELLGGKPTPGVGFGTGFERIILNLKREGVPVPPIEPPLVFVAHTTEAARVPAIRIARRLRHGGRSVVLGSAGRSLKSQLRQAGGVGARYVFILGEQELAQGQVTVKNLVTGEQVAVAYDAAEDVIAT